MSQKETPPYFCPITQRERPSGVKAEPFDTSDFTRYDDDVLGTWICSKRAHADSIMKKGPIQSAPPGPGCPRALLASKIRGSKFTGKPVVLCSDGEYNISDQDYLYAKSQRVTPSMLIDEASLLKYDHIITKSMILLRQSEAQGSQGFGDVLFADSNMILFPKGFGLLYGLPIPSLIDGLKLMVNKGLLSHTNRTYHLTPQGYEFAEEAENTKVYLKNAFLICKFNTTPRVKGGKTKDQYLFDEVYSVVGERNDCKVARAKDFPENGLIAKTIESEIEKATFLIVDLTESNFNVGLEAGMATKAKGEIIWTCEGYYMKELTKSSIGNPIIDVTGNHILKYEVDNLDEFQRSLNERMLSALKKRAT